MKKYFLLALAIVFGVFYACQKEPEPIKVTDITISASSVSMAEGETLLLTATISPNNADNKAVIWSTSDASVATVDNGLVTAIRNGATTITVKSDDGGYTATCEVLVKTAVSGISLDRTELSLQKGEEAVLVVTIVPDNASNKNIFWSSTDVDIAVVDNGVVTAVGNGTASIIASTEDGGKTASCSVVVSTAATEISLDKTHLYLGVGASETLSVSFVPEDASNRKVLWSSGNPDIASVEDGVVTANKVGKTTISAVSEDGDLKASCEVTVIIPVTSISLDRSEAILPVGEQLLLTANVLPADASVKDVEWSSSNEDIVTVKDGLLKAVGAGNTIINAVTVEGGKTASCTVTVFVPVKGLSLSESSVSMVVGQSKTLAAYVSPSDATDKSVVWSTSDPAVVSVEAGTITAKAEGSATVSVTTNDGGYSASCSVKVAPKATSLKLSRESFMGANGKSYEIKVVTEPENAACNVTWTTSNSQYVARLAGVSEDSRTATIRMSNDNYTGTTRLKATDTNSGLSAYLDIILFVEDFTWTENTGKTYSAYPLVTIMVGEEYPLKYSCSPMIRDIFGDPEHDLVFYEPSYVVDSPSVIKLSSNGTITGLKPGTVGIKPTYHIMKKSGGVDRVYIKVVDHYEEEEPNNDFPYANEIRPGMPISFRIGSMSDVDVFTFTNPKDAWSNEKFTIQWDYEGDGGGEELRMLGWELYNSEYTLFGSGTIPFTGAGGSYSLDKWLNTSTGYLRFFFPSKHSSYPEMRTSGQMTVRITE